MALVVTKPKMVRLTKGQIEGKLNFINNKYYYNHFLLSIIHIIKLKIFYFASFFPNFYYVRHQAFHPLLR